MKGMLRVAVGSSALAAEHSRLLRVAVRRGNQDDGFLESTTKIGPEYGPLAREAAKSLWSRRLIQEHHSAAVFARLLPQLIEAEATLDAKTTLMRMAIDELHHAAICGRVLEALDAPPEIETDLATTPLPEHEGCTPLERALRNVLFVSCLSETYAVAITAEERHEARDPIVKLAIDRIHSDESLHARFGWLYVAESIPKLSPEALARTNSYLRVAFGYLEKKELEAMPIEKQKFSKELLFECAGLGVTDTAVARELFFQTIDEVIVPELENLGLDARAAWRERRKE